MNRDEKITELAMRAALDSQPHSVIDYCAEEVRRQGHDTTQLDGIERVGWMLDAWSYALSWATIDPRPSIGHLHSIGSLIEVEKNRNGFRTCGVRVGSRICPPAQEVQPRLEHLWEHGAELKPLEFYRELLEIHPFVDGNGRTGKIVLNWLNKTLLNPVFPPPDFWGHPIRNP
jgi:hypothetical protein